jgi:peptide/nickel transport system substrate-binding protein
VLADSWDAAEDGLSLTFYLKEGVTFHDGTPWNADAAMWSFDKWLDPEWVGYDEAWDPVIASVDKVDDMTIKVTFESPYATFFADQVVKYFVSPTAYEAEGVDGFGLAPVGTGAWIPTDIVPNDHVTYRKNPDYTWGGSWTNGQPAAADIFEIRFNTDQAVAYASLETGEVTFTDLPAQFLVNAEEDPNIMVNKGTSGSLFYLGINYTKEIYNVPEFRYALAHAVDQEEVILAAFEGEAFKTCQYLPAGTPGYRAETDQYACDKWNYDPATSNQILDDLGWVDTNGDGVRERDGEELVFPIIYNTEEAIGRAAEVIQGQLSDIGIALELNPMEAAAQAEILVAEQQDFFIRAYGYPDPVILSWMVYYPNRNALNDEGSIALGNAADATIDNDARMEAVDALNRYLIDMAAWFPIWTPYTYVGYQANLQGAIFDFQGGIIFHNATVTP